MIKLIIFDYDGVIVDSFPQVHNMYKIICQELGKDCPEDLEDFKKVYGRNSSECYLQLGFNEEDILKGNEIYRREVRKIIPAIFEGVAEVVRKLSKKYKLVVLSSSYREDIENKLRRFGISDCFLEVFGREAVRVKRIEKVEAIKEVLSKYKVLEEETLLIGDRNVDFVEGSKAGLNNIVLVDYGWGYDLSEIPEYDQKFSIIQPSDLLEAVEIYNK